MHLSVDQFTRLRDALEAYCGVYLDDTKQRWLEVSIRKWLDTTENANDSYQRWLQGGATFEGLPQLAELLLNHETTFFRNQPLFQALQQTIIPSLHQGKPIGEPLRLWSAGCSTGEEAYSLAMIAQSVVGNQRPIQIWATDLSQRAVRQAKAGVYAERGIGNIPPALRSQYLVPQEQSFVIVDALKQLVTFESMNVCEAFPPQARDVDLIICQNVMIYFRHDNKQRLVQRFHNSLREDGLLCLGFSETLWGISDAFRAREMPGTYVYYKTVIDRSGPQQVIPSASRTNSSTVNAGNRPLASPMIPEEILGLARIHADRDELVQALVLAHQVVAINPLMEEAYLLLGTLYGRQEKWAAAITQLERAQSLCPESALISFQLAEMYWSAKHLERAMREYQRALQKLDHHPPGDLLEGVAVGWLQDTCQRRIGTIAQSIQRPKKRA